MASFNCYLTHCCCCCFHGYYWGVPMPVKGVIEIMKPIWFFGGGDGNGNFVGVVGGGGGDGCAK